MSTQREHWLSKIYFYCLLAVLAVATLPAAPGNAQAPEAPAAASAELTLEAAVEIALTHSPGLAALDAHSDTLDAVPPEAGALPDPVLSVNALNLPTDTFDFDQEPMTQIQIALVALVALVLMLCSVLQRQWSVEC